MKLTKTLFSKTWEPLHRYLNISFDLLDARLGLRVSLLDLLRSPDDDFVHPTLLVSAHLPFVCLSFTWRFDMQRPRSRCWFSAVEETRK